jgi:hypothetical protein
MTPRARVRPCRLLSAAAVLLLLAPAAPVAAQHPLIVIGTFAESNYSVQPGVQLGYSTPGLLGGAARVTASASTTRLATAFGSNALAEDRVQLSAAWLFRRGSRITPYVALSGGFTRFDRDDGEIFALLDNRAPLLSVLFGAETRARGPLRLHAHAGYSALHSSTVYPFVAAVGMSLDVRGGTR